MDGEQAIMTFVRNSKQRNMKNLLKTRQLFAHSQLQKRKISLLIAGSVLLILSHLNWNVDNLAWISSVPFLLYLNLTKGFRSRLLFYIFLNITWILIVFKIISDPIPYYIIPLYSIPISLIQTLGYMVYARYKESKFALLLFPAAMVILEWIQFTFTPMASWGVAAYTQIDNSGLLQSLSLFGMSGLSFLIYFTNSAIVDIILKGKRNIVNFYIPLFSIIALLIFGQFRLSHSSSYGKNTMKIAAIGTDSKAGGLPLPSQLENEKDIQGIFRRTELAAKAGAKLAIWTEAAFILLPEYEKHWQDSISELARRNNIAIVASYVVPISFDPFQFENKYLWFDAAGKITKSYFKHEPVPGEPAVKGKATLTTEKLGGSSIGGAICYDYDFPYLAAANRKAGADIVALPSSDWRGIDPLHTKMAAYRAIEQGHSIVRSTRFGLSAGIDPYGKIIAQISSFDENDKILLVNMPAKKVATLYSYVGDVVVFLSIIILIIGIWKSKPLLSMAPQQK